MIIWQSLCKIIKWFLEPCMQSEFYKAQNENTYRCSPRRIIAAGSLVVILITRWLTIEQDNTNKEREILFTNRFGMRLANATFRIGSIFCIIEYGGFYFHQFSISVTGTQYNNVTKYFCAEKGSRNFWGVASRSGWFPKWPWQRYRRKPVTGFPQNVESFGAENVRLHGKVPETRFR